MRARQPKTYLEGTRIHSANDRWKAQWNERVAWSLVAAAALHATVFSLAPGWIKKGPVLAEERDPFEFEWILLEEEYSSGGLGVATSAPPVSDRTDSLQIEPDLGGRNALSTAELERLAERLRGRFLERGTPPPELAQVASEQPGDDPNQSGEGTSTRGADPSTSEYPYSPVLSEVDLGKLSAVRPEVAIAGSSNWALVRNPIEVTEFLNRRYMRGDIPPSAQGTVSVTLWVSESGSVEWAEISRSSGRAELDEVTLALFNEVVAFRPARDEGVPTAMSMVFSLDFPWATGKLKAGSTR